MSSILSNFLAGQQAGQQQHQYRQEQSKLAQLRELAPSVLAGNPEAYGQSMALDSAHTERLQDGRTKQLGQLEGMVKFVDAARATNDPRQLAGAMRTIAPFMKTLTGQDIDPDAPWTPEYDTGWEAFKAQIAGARNAGASSDLASFNAYTQGLSPEDVTRARRIKLGLDPRAVTGAMRFDTFTDANGNPRPQRNNPTTGQVEIYVDETGQWQSLGGGAGASMAAPAAGGGTVFTTSEGQRFDVSQVQDPHLRQQIMANPDAYGMAPDGAQAQLPVRDVSAYGSNPAAGLGRGRSKEAETAATERAKLQAQADFLPQELAMRGQAAVDQAVGIERGKSELEQQQAATGRQRDAGTALELLGEAERLLPQATGGRVAAVGDAVAGAFGHATSGAQANAALATIAGQLTSKMPRMEGPQSDRDVQMYKEMAGDLANANLPVETRLAALEQIRRLQSKYAGGQQRQQRPVMVHSPADYNALPAGALYTAPDGSTRRKK